MELLETDIEKMVWQYFTKMGAFCQKFPKFKTTRGRRHLSPMSLNGSPDLYVIAWGRFYGVEIKRAKVGIQSEDQKQFESLLRRQGGAEYFLCTGLLDAEEIWGKIKRASERKVKEF